jgi:hypothetical protein
MKLQLQARPQNGWMPEMYYAKSNTNEGRRGGNRKENDMRVWVKRDHSILGMMVGGTSSGTPILLSPTMSVELQGTAQARASFSLSLCVETLPDSAKLKFAQCSSNSGHFGSVSFTHFYRDSTPKSATGGGGDPGNGKDGGETSRAGTLLSISYLGMRILLVNARCYYALAFPCFSLFLGLSGNLRLSFLVAFNMCVDLARVWFFPILFCFTATMRKGAITAEGKEQMKATRLSSAYIPFADANIHTPRE